MQDDSSESPDQRAAFKRTIDFVGEAGFLRLQRATVAVFGLGGVGSHAAVLLARSGVGCLRLVDFDAVTWSSLNRSAVATHADVGRSKADVVADALKRIHPAVRVDARQAFFAAETSAELLAGPPDYVVDAIDSEGPKVRLLRTCVQQNIPVVTCMGAAARIDPTLVQIADLFETARCALARNVRKRLRHEGISSGITAIYSMEEPRPSMPPDENEQVLRRGRARRRLPSLGVIPGMAGYAAAGLVIRALTEVASARSA